MLAKAMSTAHPRNTSLGMAPSFIARQGFAELVFFRTPFKSASVILATNCMFVIIQIDGFRPAPPGKRVCLHSFMTLGVGMRKF
jgi:hypothetical protein